jgi:hypothetical protein
MSVLYPLCELRGRAGARVVLAPCHAVLTGCVVVARQGVGKPHHRRGSGGESIPPLWAFQA